MDKTNHGDQFLLTYRKGPYQDLFFFIYINDIPNGLKRNVKLFADDTSIFSIVKNKNGRAKDLTHDISLISKWAIQWKMLSNPDPTKPAQEVISRKKR